MKRRDFLRSGPALLSIPTLLQACNAPGDKEMGFPIEVNSDHLRGHVIRHGTGQLSEGKTLKTEVLVVGGGVAGLAAASALSGKTDFLLCELSDRLGGTSSAREWNGYTFAEGAHYELEYPAYYGEEVLKYLETKGIVYYREWKDSWTFTDRQHIIPFRRQGHCLEKGEFREDVLAPSPVKRRFIELIREMEGSMPLPSRLIPETHYPLNGLDFQTYLQNELGADKDFLRQMDYHMRDDWGAPCREVSALAGLHYFACRPYYTQVVELFSPPSGNAWFVRKLAGNLPPKRVLCNHMVVNMRQSGNGMEVGVIDFMTSERKTILADKVIWTAKKHMLNHLYTGMPEPSLQVSADNGGEIPRNTETGQRFVDPFNPAQSAWMVINFCLENRLPGTAYWQNEMLVEDETFLGFIDSRLQYMRPTGDCILTAYYCFPPDSAADLLSTEKRKAEITQKTLAYLNAWFEKDLTPLVRKVFIRPIGHAMPIPGPGYLLRDLNEISNDEKVIYAGVDNGRLPLFLEAVDSGLEAVKRLG